MNSEQSARQLAAILISEVVGYSTLMTEDAITTRKLLKRFRVQVSDPVIVDHGGKVVKPMGDGVRVISPPMAGPLRLAQTARDLGGRRDRTWLSEAMENKASRRRFEALAVRTDAAAPRANISFASKGRMRNRTSKGRVGGA